MPRPMPLAYLFSELNLSPANWKSLSDPDKENLKQWATEEMDLKEKAAA